MSKSGKFSLSIFLIVLCGITLILSVSLLSSGHRYNYGSGIVMLIASIAFGIFSFFLFRSYRSSKSEVAESTSDLENPAVQCKSCNSNDITTRFLGGSQTAGTILIIFAIGTFATEQNPFGVGAGIVLILAAIMAYTSKKYRCKNCKATFN